MLREFNKRTIIGLFVVIFSFVNSNLAHNELVCVPCNPKSEITNATISQLRGHRIDRPSVISIDFNEDTKEIYSIYSPILRGSSYPNGMFILRPFDLSGEIIWDAPLLDIQPEIADIGTYNWTTVAHHPDKPWIALGSSEGYLQIWNLETASSLKLLDISSPITDVAFSPTNDWIAAIRDHTQVVQYLLEDDALQELELPENTTYVSNLSFNSDGSLLASSADDAVVIWQTDTFSPSFVETEGTTLNQVMFLPTVEDQLVTVADDQVTLWTIENNQLIETQVFETPPVTIETPSETIASLNYDGSVLVAIYDHSQIVTWDTTTGKLIEVEAFSILEDSDIYALDFSPDGLWLAVATSRGIRFFIIP